MFSAGQTDTVGNCISLIGLVSTVVLMGLLDQLVKDWWIRYPEMMNPELTTQIQNSLAHFRVDAMKFNPLIDEDSRNSRKFPIFNPQNVPYLRQVQVKVRMRVNLVLNESSHNSLLDYLIILTMPFKYLSIN